MAARAETADGTDIRITAASVLDALLENGPLPGLPAETPEWARAFLNAFRAFRRSQRGREAQTAAERLGRTAAANPFRFFWEFWQNADDAGATELRFDVQSHALVISNNGRPFSTVEIFSLLTVGGSTKYGDDHTMGQWGVGALALMRFSDRPTYESGPWAFDLEQSYTYPGEASNSSPDGVAGLRVVAPFRPDVDPDALSLRLAALLNDEALLYMRHLERVTVTSPTGVEWSVEARVERSGPASRVELGDAVWLRYEEELTPPRDLTRDDGRNPPASVHLALARRARATSSPSNVYVFFPTQVRHEYPWRFSAPLDVTTGREGLLESKYNRWLLRSVGRTMVRASGHHIAGNKSAPWNLVPFKPDSESLLSEVWSGALDEMSTAAWLPAGRRHVRPDEAAFAESSTVRELVRATDLAELSGGRRVWLAGVPGAYVQDALAAAGVMRVGPHEVARVLSTASRSRGPTWFLRAACAVLGGPKKAETTELLVSGKCFLSARGVPFSLKAASDDGKVVCNTRSEVLSGELGDLFAKNLVVLLHRMYRVPEKKSDSELDRLRKRLDEWLREESSDETFSYESRFDASAFIKLFVVDRDAAARGGDVADRLLSFARDHLESYVSDQGKANREQTYSQLGEALRIKAFRWDLSRRRVSEYRRASEVHLAGGYVDRPWWPDAARGVPGIWWCDSRYRKDLVRRDSPLSVNGFLKLLGAADGPRVVALEKNGWHNVHHFVRVTHGDAQRYPNFPHSAVKFGTYSEYGLPNDWDAPELTLVLDHLETLPAAERSRRGEALLRMFEEQWDRRFKEQATTRATGYYANGEYHIRGDVPARWLWNVRNRDWVDRGRQGLGSPSQTYARIPSTVALVDSSADALSAWESRDAAVANALGFRTQVAADVVLRYLREARQRETPLGSAIARAYYAHLGRLGEAAKDAWQIIAAERLVYCERSRVRWRSPMECLQGDFRDVFGPFAGYLNVYPEAASLWDSLSIRRHPDFEFFASIWADLSVSVDPGDAELRRVLPAVYAAAEPLAPPAAVSRPVPVVSEKGWIDSTSAFVTRSTDLSRQLVEQGLVAWDNPYFEMHPRLTKALGILDADRDSVVKVLAGLRTPASDDEQQVHKGVTSFAAEVHAAQPELWRLLEARLREIVEGRIERLRPLKLRVALKHPRLHVNAFEIGEAAYYRDGALYLSELTTASDRAVSSALLAGLPLSGEVRWAATNGLQLHLTQELGSAGAFPFDDPVGDLEEPEEDLFALFDPATTGTSKKRPRTEPPRERKPEPPPHPIDAYVVSSDDAEDEDSGEATGGLVPRGKAKLRRPGHSGGVGGGYMGVDRHSRNATEQRGVDLFRWYVLDPDGVQVKDQRIRDRVGADLIGDDGVFRELKTFSGAAATSLSLTEHEYRRADNHGEAYQLVIVEHVWDDAVITVITDPLTRLRYTPTGGVVVQDWREPNPRPRVLNLRMKDVTD